MAILFATTSRSVTYTIAAGNTLIVPASVIAAFDGSFVISGPAAPVAVIVDGIVAGGTGWAVGLNGGTIDVGASGRILATCDRSGFAAWIGNSDGLPDLVAHRGLIDGSLGTGVGLYGTAAELQNAGTIRGQHAGVSVIAADASVTNTGTISGGVPDGADTQTGGGSALWIFGDFARIANAGQIAAVAPNAAAIRLESVQGAEISNAGTLQSLRGAAVDGAASAHGFTLLNAGRIVGQDGAVLGGQDIDILANRGFWNRPSPISGLPSLSGRGAMSSAMRAASWAPSIWARGRTASTAAAAASAGRSMAGPMPTA